MKERPILFDSQMVNAILDGSKTQTRRPIILDNPYGNVGDRLWVRETWVADKQVDHISPSSLGKSEPIYYPADKKFYIPGCEMIQRGKKRPSIFMPRWASRINLEITGLRLEQLNDISEEDSVKEGVRFNGSYYEVWYGDHYGDSHFMARDAFAELWMEAYGKDSWTSNPLVWVIEFERV